MRPEIALIEIWHVVDQRWRWRCWDSRGRPSHACWPAGFSRIEACRDNLATILGCEVELLKERGMYRKAIVIGRNIPIEVIR